MRRAVVLLSWPVAAPFGGGTGWGSGSGGTGSGMTEFAHKAAALKRRHRGKGQYEFARREAEQFLEREVPQGGTSMWIEQGTNAVALAQLLSFFEIEPDSSLEALITNKLLRTLEESSHDGITRLLAAIALTQRGDQHVERIFAAVDRVLRETGLNAGSGGVPSVDGLDAWNIIEHAAKVLQRGAKHAPSSLGESLAQVAMIQLQRTMTTDMPRLQASLLRVYSWLVRFGKVTEANHFLLALVDHTGEFHSFDFSTLMSSCLRHHQLCPFPLQLLFRLARTGLTYSTLASGRDVANIVGTVAKIVGSLETGKNGVTQGDVCELGGRLNMLLEEYESRVLRFLDTNDKLYWNHCDDVTSIVFAYEMGGRLRYRHVFVAYQGYVAHQVTRFEPQQLAMAAGILRRSNLLTQELAVRLGERIESVLGDFSLTEISHVCATFAPMSPPWMGEAKAVAARLLVPECSSYTKLLLGMAFPDDDTLHAQVNVSEISGKQLVDALSLMHGTKFDGLIVAELTTRLHAARERFSADDIHFVQATGRPELQAACVAFLSSRFAEPQWTSDTLYSLPLAVAIVPHARDAAKALSVVKSISVSPEQFVSLAELLVGVFGTESDEGINAFVVNGGLDLLSAERIQLRTVLRYMEAVRPIQKMFPNAEWIARFNERFSRQLHDLTAKDLESLLCSLCAVYGNVARQPLLQQTLTEITSGSFERLTQPDETLANIVLMIAQLQQGAPQPFLTESTPVVRSVRNNAINYHDALKEAVTNLSLPREVEQKRVGRFTLKMMRSVEQPPSTRTVQVSQDLNEALVSDPFADAPPAQLVAETGAGGPTSVVASASEIPSLTVEEDFSSTHPSGDGAERRDNHANAPSSLCKESVQDSAPITPRSDTRGIEPTHMSAPPAAVSAPPLVSTPPLPTPPPHHRQPQQEAQLQPIEHAVIASPPTVERKNTSSSSNELWSMFSNSFGSLNERQPNRQFGLSSPTSSSLTHAGVVQPPRESQSGSSYTGRFSHSNQSHAAARPVSLQEGSYSGESAVAAVQQDQVEKPRRTNINPSFRQRTEFTTSSSAPAVSRSHAPGVSKFGVNTWSLSPSNNAAWGQTTQWDSHKETPAVVQGTSMPTFGSSWSSMNMQPSASFAASGVGGFFSSAPGLQEQQQQHVPQPYQHLQVPHQQHMQTHSYSHPPQQHHRQQFPPRPSPYNPPVMQTTTQGNLMPPRSSTPTQGNHMYFEQQSGARPRPVITKNCITKSPNTSTVTEENDRGFWNNIARMHAGVSSKTTYSGSSRLKGGTDSSSASVGDKKSARGEVGDKKSGRTTKYRQSLAEWLNTPPDQDLETVESRRESTSAPQSPTVKGKVKEVEKRVKGKEKEKKETAVVAPAAATTTATAGGKSSTAAKGKIAGKKTTPPAKSGKGAAKVTEVKTPVKSAAKQVTAKTNKAASKTTPKKKNEPKTAAKKSATPASGTSGAGAAAAAPAPKKKPGRKPADKGKGGKK
ncbi:hypothetical protein TRVL_01218 [Trypanosoma vivax]|nr:hypothetical protein TRVL_01218 [Trypanosoma vivax]